MVGLRSENTGCITKRSFVNFLYPKKNVLVSEAANKSNFLNGRAIKGGGGVKGPAVKKKTTFFVT